MCIFHRKRKASKFKSDIHLTRKQKFCTGRQMGHAFISKRKLSILVVQIFRKFGDNVELFCFLTTSHHVPFKISNSSPIVLPVCCRAGWLTQGVGRAGSLLFTLYWYMPLVGVPFSTIQVCDGFPNQTFQSEMGSLKGKKYVKFISFRLFKLGHF